MALQQALVTNDPVRYVYRTNYESLCPYCNLPHRVTCLGGQWVFMPHVRRGYGYDRLRSCDGNGKPIVNRVRVSECVYVQHS